MKKTYVTPIAELVRFDFRDQVVAASVKCVEKFQNVDNDGVNGCDTQVSVGWNSENV